MVAPRVRVKSVSVPGEVWSIATDASTGLVLTAVTDAVTAELDAVPSEPVTDTWMVSPLLKLELSRELEDAPATVVPLTDHT